jgi:hypothetical protein
MADGQSRRRSLEFNRRSPSSGLTAVITRKRSSDGAGLGRLAPSRSGKIEPEFSQFFEAARNLIARLQPHALVLGLADDHALRRAGEKDVTGLDREHLGREADELAAVEDHVVGVPILPLLAIDARLKTKVVRVAHEIAGDQIRAERGEAVA